MENVLFFVGALIEGLLLLSFDIRKDWKKNLQIIIGGFLLGLFVFIISVIKSPSKINLIVSIFLFFFFFTGPWIYLFRDRLLPRIGKIELLTSFSLIIYIIILQTDETSYIIPLLSILLVFNIFILTKKRFSTDYYSLGIGLMCVLIILQFILNFSPILTTTNRINHLFAGMAGTYMMTYLSFFTQFFRQKNESDEKYLKRYDNFITAIREKSFFWEDIRIRYPIFLIFLTFFFLNHMFDWIPAMLIINIILVFFPLSSFKT